MNVSTPLQMLSAGVVASMHTLAGDNLLIEQDIENEVILEREL